MLFVQSEYHFSQKIHSIVQTVMCSKQVASANPGLRNAANTILSWAAIPFQVFGANRDASGPEVLGRPQFLSEQFLALSFWIEDYLGA
jgi:hypothetical protein